MHGTGIAIDIEETDLGMKWVYHWGIQLELGHVMPKTRAFSVRLYILTRFFLVVLAVAANAANVFAQNPASNPAHNGGIATVFSIEDLRHLVPKDVGPRPTVEVQNYNTPSDGGGGLFQWEEASSLPDDGGAVIEPAGGTPLGRWVRQALTASYASGVNKPFVLDPRWWGAKTDGSDSTAAFSAMMNAAATFDPKGDGIVVNLTPGNWNTGKIPTHRAVMWNGSGERVTSWSINMARDEIFMEVPEGNIFDGIQFGRNVRTYAAPLFRVTAATGFRNIFANMNGPLLQQDSGNLSLSNVSIFPGGPKDFDGGLAMIDIRGGNFIGRDISIIADRNRYVDVTGVRFSGGINLRLDGLSESRLGVGLEIVPSPNKAIGHVALSGIYLDQMLRQGIAVLPADHATIGQIDVFGVDVGYAGKSGTPAILIAGAGNLKSYAQFGGVVHNGGGHGMQIDRRSANVLINGTSFQQNDGDGINVTAQSGAYQIISVRCGSRNDQTLNKGPDVSMAGISSAAPVTNCQDGRIGDIHVGPR